MPEERPTGAEPSPLISVVTPSYNQGRFIGDAVESVLGQGLARFEHIVVDAESTDETAEVLARYPHLRVFRGKDRGQSDALNKGFLAARAPLICWLNADDYLLDGAFRRVLPRFQADPGIGALVGHYYMVEEGGEFLASMRVPPFDAGVMRHYGVVLPTSGSYFATRVFRDEGLLLDIDYRIMMDWDFYQRLGMSGVRIEHVPHFLAAFRVHAENKSIGLRDDDEERRRRYDARRFQERRRFHATYGPRLGPEELTHAVQTGLFHAHHARFVAKKLVRGYYLANRLDRLRPPDVRPAGRR